MRYTLATIVVCCILSLPLPAQDIHPEIKITIISEDTELSVVLERLAREDNLYFTYFTSLPSLQKKICCHIEDIPLSKALEELFKNTGISFQFYGNNIILKEEETRPSIKYSVSGTIMDSETRQPISYASIQVKNTCKGTIANQFGEFEMTVISNQIHDTLYISSMGYEAVTLHANLLSQKGTHKIFLTPKIYNIPQVKVSTERRITKQLGNHGKFSLGSLFMDTQGQQTAVYLENTKSVEGRVKTVNYYLSGKGNTEAPFRVRIYAVDSVTGIPGEDLLPEMLVITPGEETGWYKVNVLQYDIQIPRHGIFVAMESVYPNEYEFYQDGSDFIDISGIDAEPDPNNIINTKEYGQRLGYNRKGTNNTWHYSIDHHWYQIDKKNFNVMMSADVITRKGMAKFFNFGKDEDQD